MKKNRNGSERRRGKKKGRGNRRRRKNWRESRKNREEWRLRLNLARKWAEIVNANGGDAKIVHLPEIGVKGNTHFPFSDLNNEEIADLMEKWLEEKGLNK